MSDLRLEITLLPFKGSTLGRCTAEKGFRQHFGFNQGSRVLSRGRCSPDLLVGRARLRVGVEEELQRIEDAVPKTDDNQAVFGLDGVWGWRMGFGERPLT